MVVYSSAITYSPEPRNCIGSMGAGFNSNFFNGVIDELRVYDKALNQCEIEHFCNSEANNVNSIETLNSIASSVNCYPNPSKDFVNIDIEGYTGTHNVVVYDFSGRLLQTTNSSRINIKDYAKGVYLFIVRYGTEIQKIKVIKD